jgi:hypothetical protein
MSNKLLQLKLNSPLFRALDKFSSCRGKVQFLSLGKAEAAARAATRNLNNGEFEAYRCRYYEHFHIGHRRNVP